MLQPAQKQHCGQRSPYLRLHSIARRADETLYLQQLLDVPEEDLDLPPRFVQLGDCGGCKHVLSPLSGNSSSLTCE